MNENADAIVNRLSVDGEETYRLLFHDTLA